MINISGTNLIYNPAQYNTASSIPLLRKAKSCVPKNPLKRIYNGMLPHFTSATTVWNDGTHAITDKLTNLRGEQGM